MSRTMRISVLTGFLSWQVDFEGFFAIVYEGLLYHSLYMNRREPYKGVFPILWFEVAWLLHTKYMSRLWLGVFASPHTVGGFVSRTMRSSV